MNTGKSNAVNRQKQQSFSGSARKRSAAPGKKVALVTDWLVDIGGAERVVLELHRLFPKAPIYTSQYDPSRIDWFKKADVRTGWLQKIPNSLRKFLPILRAKWFSGLDLSEYDLVISASGAEAKFVKTPDDTVHIAYIHAPTHYYWSRYQQYIDEPGFGAFDWLARLGLKLFVGPMRRKDYQAAQRPDHLLANSSHTKKQIKKYYQRDSVVIHPPVDLARFKQFVADQKSRHGFVIAGRMTPYKKIDLAVMACTKLGLPLVVIGDGPEYKKLKKIAGHSIFFTGIAYEKDVAKYVGSSKAFIFPGVDDFGIAPVEALAAGTPIVAFKGGGALDYVKDGQNGRFFTPQTIDGLCKALKKIESENYTPEDIKHSAEPFSINNFHKNIKKLLRSI